MGNQSSVYEKQSLVGLDDEMPKEIPVIYAPKEMTDKQVHDKITYWFQKVCQTLEGEDQMWKTHVENLRESSQKVVRKTYIYRIQNPSAVFCLPQVDIQHPSVKKMVGQRGILGPRFKKKISLAGPNFTHTTVSLDWNDVYGIEILLQVTFI